MYSKNKLLLSSYYSLLNSLIFKKSLGFFFNLIVKGRNYRFFFTGKSLCFIFGFSHFILCKIPKSILVCSVNLQTNIVSFFSHNESLLRFFMTFLIDLSFCDVYKGKGLHFLDVEPILKVGKKQDSF